MTATEKLQVLAREYAKQTKIVTEEYSTMTLAASLMKKWDESRLVDAIYREAKARAIKAVA